MQVTNLHMAQGKRKSGIIERGSRIVQKRKNNFNFTYISERLKDNLEPISQRPLTTVIAPMGYGKTTAINWYLTKGAKAEDISVIRISVYSDNLLVFWKSVQNAFAYAGFDFLSDYPYPSDVAGAGMLADDLYHELSGEKPCYIFVDDFHLLKNEKVSLFLCQFANRMPENVHLIVAGRNRCLPMAQIMRLGAKVYQIGTEQLRLNYEELSVYSHYCGTELTNEQMERLLYHSEGWFSAVYLNLLSFAKHGKLLEGDSDIYTMFMEAMIEPLAEPQRKFLSVMGLADEFTTEMAEFITGASDTEEILTVLTEQNAFVKRLPDGVTFRFHHMMKECAERKFKKFTQEEQDIYWNRFGAWYENAGQYLYAMSAYEKSKNYDALLRVIQIDAGIILSYMNPADVQKMLDVCSVSTIKKYPFAILVLMRSMFNWRQIPKMMEMKSLLMESIAEQNEMTQEERGNLLGECELIMSFLMFNDISAMSRLHRSASAQMTKPAVSIQKSGGWTFGSPSILMQYYREPGGLESELAEMFECMPHYYKITNGHGQGAEWIMSAEAKFQKGAYEDCRIDLEKAYIQSRSNEQHNIELCADFLMMRLALCVDIEERYTYEQRYRYLKSLHNPALINIFHASCAYYYALRNETDKISEVFRLHKLSEITMLAPGKPIIEMIENQVYLAQKAFAKVLGRNEALLSICENMHFKLVAIHLNIQSVAAYEKLGKRMQSRELLRNVITEAEPDGFVMPFVENFHYLKDLLDSMQNTGFVKRIIELGREYEKRRTWEKERVSRPKEFENLTEREYEIVDMMTKHFSNREIAEKLFLSEGTVKQYINRIYAKLHMEGETRTKRKQLLHLASEES